MKGWDFLKILFNQKTNYFNGGFIHRRVNRGVNLEGDKNWMEDSSQYSFPYQIFFDSLFQKCIGTKFIIPILAIFLFTVAILSQENVSRYKKTKMWNLIRKSKKIRTKTKTLFIIPKLAIILYMTLSQYQQNSNVSSLKQNMPESSNDDFLDTNFLSYCNNAKTRYIHEQMTLASVSNLKIHNRDKFLRILLLLTGNVELNPGPTNQFATGQQENIYDNFKCRGMHFFHLNINSVLPKIDELRIIAKEMNPSVIGLTETKIDSSVNDEEIHINGYTLERSDRDRRGGGVACYIRSDLSYNVRNTFSDEIENIFVDIMLPKTKPILVVVIYRPPDKSDFL